MNRRLQKRSLHSTDIDRFAVINSLQEPRAGEQLRGGYLPAGIDGAAPAGVATHDVLTGDLVAQVISRAITALTRSVVSLPPRTARNLITATASKVLATLAERALETEGTDLSRARLRGVQERYALTQRVGGFLSGKVVAELLNISAAAVHKRYKAHQLLGIKEAKRRLSYPAIQFDQSGPAGVVPHLPEVLRVLAEAQADDWSQLVFLTGENARLKGQSPIVALHEGRLTDVLSAARAFGEHGGA